MDNYPYQSPYTYCGWNPVMIVDPDGKEIDPSELYRKDKSGNYVHKTQVQAFDAFAHTAIGQNFLSKYAKKGQTIAGITFTKNGQYHNRKIDLILNGEKGLYKGDIRSGQCGADIINGRLKLTIATEKDSHIDEGLETFIHEIIIHAEQYSKDFIDNGKLDNSQVYPELKKIRDEARLWSGRISTLARIEC